MPVQLHQYADDTQLYLGISSTSIDWQLLTLESCTLDVFNWLTHNGLALNPSKSESIVFANSRSKPLQLLADTCTTVTVAGAPIPVSANIKSLGVYLDRSLSFDKHVSEIAKSCYYHIRSLRHVRTSLTLDVAKTIACSIVGSRLDYCNSLFTGLSVKNLDRLQLVQNTLARVVTNTKRSDHITPVRFNLHWLPVGSRITFKVATLTYRARTFGQPSYRYLGSLVSTLSSSATQHVLRSSTTNRTDIPRRKTAMAQHRSFSSAASAIWNSLPLELTSSETLSIFRTDLKQRLFKLAYPDYVAE